MNLRNLMGIQAIFLVLAGLATLLVPQAYLSPFGVTLDESGVGFARLSAATVLALAVMSWLARDTAPSQARRAMVIGLFAGNALAFVVVVVNMLTGTYASLTWVTAVIFLLLGVGFAYFLRQPDAALKPSR